jgi:hypothetical protein
MSSPPRLRAQTKPSVSGQDGVVRQAELQRKRAQYEDNERRSFLRDGADARQKKLEASLFMQPRRADTGRSRPASAASLRRSSGDYAKARSRGDVERDRMHRRPQSAGGLGVAQRSARPLHEQRSGLCRGGWASLAFSIVNRLCSSLLYGHAGRLFFQNLLSGPGQGRLERQPPI